MVHRNFLAAIVLALPLASVACGGKKTPVKDPNTDDPATTKVAPAPPKCESLDESCAAQADTVAKVKSAGLTFKPPERWLYAQTASHSIMQQGSDAGAAVLVIGSYMSDKDAKKNDAARDAAFADLLKALGATLPKSYKVAWKKPEAPLEANGLKMGTWLAPDVERTGLKDKKGNMPIVHAPIDATHNMLAIGFALGDDEKGMEAVQGVLMSIKPDAGAAEGDKKPEGDKK